MYHSTSCLSTHRHRPEHLLCGHNPDVHKISVLERPDQKVEPRLQHPLCRWAFVTHTFLTILMDWGSIGREEGGFLIAAQRESKHFFNHLTQSFSALRSSFYCQGNVSHHYSLRPVPPYRSSLWLARDIMSTPVLCPPVEKDLPTTGKKTTGKQPSSMSKGLQANFATLKKRKLDPAATRKVAEQTARLVESEITQLRNSVAELEAMLMAREQQQDDDDDGDDEDGDSADDDELDLLHLPAKNRFPLLPPDMVAIPDSGMGGTDAEDDVDSDLDEDELDE